MYAPGVVLKNINLPPIKVEVSNPLKLPSVITQPSPPAVIVSATKPSVFAEPNSAVAEANLTAILLPCDPETYTTWPFVNDEVVLL